MARRPTKSQAARFRALIAELEPAMRRAFQEAVAGLYSGIVWRDLIDRLGAGDIEGAIAATNIDASAFAALYQANQAAFMAGAAETVATLGISGVSRADALGIRFDMTNPRAEGFIATSSSMKIRQIVEDTRDAVRQVIVAGYEAGRGPRDIATDIAGRVVSGRRQGGVLGLDRARAYRLGAIRDGISSPEGIADLIVERRNGTLGLRYKTTPFVENKIIAAYRRGAGLSRADQSLIVDRFRNALLKHRADTVAQVETAQAVMAGRREEWAQVLEKLGRDPSDVEKTWQHGSGGTDPRPHHEAMNGVSVRGLDTPFEFSNGARLQYAHDMDGGPAEVIRCTCDTTFRLLPDVGALR